MNIGSFQLINWWKWIGLGRSEPYPSSGKYRGMVYRWRFRLFFIEIRRFEKELPEE
jgi:hypothetical protein